jgi:hypothetical protein
VAYFHARYTPQSRTGGLGRGVAYYTWREEPQHPLGRPRVWHAHDGRELDYAAARAEIAAAAKEAPYTYRLVLSTREVPLTSADYGAVLGPHFERWYFTAHHGGDHPHAHGVAFAPRPLRAHELNAMRFALGDRERAREHELAQEAPAPAASRDRAPHTEHAQEVSWW